MRSARLLPAIALAGAVAAALASPVPASAGARALSPSAGHAIAVPARPAGPGSVVLARPSAARAPSHSWGTFAPPAAGQHLVGRSPRTVTPDTITNYTSDNWDGYFATAASHGTEFTAVSSTWKVAAVTCSGSALEWAGFWVGMDGWWNDVVEQGGTEALCISGSPQYYVWWEMFPFNSIQTGFAINAGDSIQASVTYVTSTQIFGIVVKDTTSGQTLTENTPCESDQQGCPRTSAEAISEDITGTGGLFPLPDYSSETYTQASVTNTSGHTGSLSDSAWQLGDVTEVSGGVTKQTTSSLNPGGTKFSTTWQHT